MLSNRQFPFVMATDDNVMYILEHVFKISKIFGMFPVIIKYQTATEFNFNQDKLVLILSVIKIIIMIIYDSLYVYRWFKVLMFEGGLANDASVILDILGMFLYHSTLHFMFLFILRCFKMFLPIFQDMQKANNLIKHRYNKSQRKNVIVIFYVYQTILTALRIFDIVNSRSSIFVFNAIASFLSSFNQNVLELQFISLLFVIYTLFKKINTKITYLFVKPLTIAQLDNLRNAYGILHDLCDKINRIYDCNIFIFLCVTNIFIQNSIYYIFKRFYDLFILKSELDYEVEYATMWLLFYCLKITLTFVMCTRVHLEVSNTK
jgi:hypothetical protein